MMGFVTNFSRRCQELALVSVLATIAFATPARSNAQMLPGSNAATNPYTGTQTIFVPRPQRDTDLVQLAVPALNYTPGEKMQKRIENDLSLSVSYNYNFSANLLAMDGRAKSRPVPDGWYLLTVAVFRAPSQNSDESFLDRYVTANERQFVQVSNGAFNAKVWLKFANVSTTVQLSHLLLELIPLEEDCAGTPCLAVDEDGEPDSRRSTLKLREGYRPLLIQAQDFVPFQTRGSSNSSAGDFRGARYPFGQQTLEQFVTLQGKPAQDRLRMQFRQQALTPEQFAAQNRLTYISLNDPQIQLASRRLWRDDSATTLLRNLLQARQVRTERLGQGYGRLWPVLCQLMATHNAAYVARANSPGPTLAGWMAGEPPLNELVRQCAYQPINRFRLSRVVHVGQVDRSQRTPILFNPQQTYTVNANSLKVRSRSTETYLGLTFQPLALLTRLTDKVLPITYTHGLSQTNSRSQGEQATTSLTDAMDFNPLGVNIPTVNSRVCLQINVVQTNIGAFYDPSPNARNGLYICGDEPQPVQVQEIYAHAFTFNRNSSLVQAFDADTQTVNRSLRGDAEVSGFFWSIRKALKADHDNTLMPWQFSQAAETYLAATPATSPRLVVSPLLFDSQSAPSVMDRLSGNYSESFLEDQARP